MHLYITKNESMLILIYPNQQKLEVDHFLSPIEFNDPQELIGTHCIDSMIVAQTDFEATVRYFTTPHLIQDIELVKLSEETKYYFAQIIDKHKEFIDQSKIVQILNLYCTFDDAVVTSTIKERILPIAP